VCGRAKQFNDAADSVSSQPQNAPPMKLRDRNERRASRRRRRVAAHDVVKIREGTRKDPARRAPRTHDETAPLDAEQDEAEN
jgi:hypothetical protein